MTRSGVLPPALTARLATSFGGLAEIVRVAGGSINEAFRIATASGPIFLKHHPRPPRTPSGVAFFAAEADGLARLAPSVQVPEVLAVWDDALVLAWVPPLPAGPTPASDAAAGHALAALHAVQGPAFGLATDNFIGALPQDNRSLSGTFADFFRARRLAPLAHYLPPELRARLERLPLDRLLTEPTQPALLHGDLWSGNLLHAATGPVFIDPAVSFGHPEQDLAMTSLFGGFSEAFYAAYHEAAGTPRDRDTRARRDVLNLYPLLVHVALFGGHYVDEVAAVLTRYA